MVSNTSIFNTLIVVPPTSVVIKYQKDNSGLVTATEMDTVTFTSGMPYGLECVIEVDGSTTSPVITTTVGDTDVMAK